MRDLKSNPEVLCFARSRGRRYAEPDGVSQESSDAKIAQQNTNDFSFHDGRALTPPRIDMIDISTGKDIPSPMCYPASTKFRYHEDTRAIVL